MAFALREPEHFTYGDILRSPDEVPMELIDGQVILMAPPSTRHQWIIGELYLQFGNFLRGKKCRAFQAPFGVRLFEQKEDTPDDVDTLVEPDLTVVCDASKIDRRGCRGAPDLVAEILSPSTARRDRLVKRELYEAAGVREYWIVDPDRESVQVYLLRDGTYLPPQTYTKDTPVPSEVLPGFAADLSTVFPEDLP